MLAVEDVDRQVAQVSVVKLRYVDTLRYISSTFSRYYFRSKTNEKVNSYESDYP